MTSRKQAIVVGGGAGGVSAGFRLHEAGFEVRLFESSDRLAGRTATERIDGYIVDIGAGILPGTYAAVQRLVEDAGLPDLLDRMTAPTAVVRDGELHYLPLSEMVRAMLKTRLLGLRSKLLLTRVAATTLKMYRHLDFENLGRAAPYDTETLADYARRELNAELLDYLLNPVQKMMYVIPADAASVVDFFWCAKNLLNPRAYCVRGGMDQLCERIARPFDVRLRTPVLNVSESAEGVSVETQDADGGTQRHHAEVCVIATPSAVTAKIHSGLKAEQRGFLQGLDYSKLVDVHLFLKQRPAHPAVVIMVPDATDRDLCGLVLEHNKGTDRAPPGKGMIRLLLTDRWAREVWACSDEEAARRALDKAIKVLPELAGLVESTYVHRWDAVATMSRPGCYAALRDFVDGLDPRARVQLAGDFYALGSVNTAVTAGENAARRLIEQHR